MKIVKSKPLFSVDEEGNIYWNKTGTKLAPFEDKDGYLRVTYRISGKSYHIAPHRAVCEMYVLNPKPDEYKFVNHKDSNRKNNSYTNLEWCSARINTNHAHYRGRFSNIKGENHSQAILTENIVKVICSLLSEGYSVSEIHSQTGQPKHRIHNIKSGKCWRDIASSYGLILPEKKKDEGLAWLLKEKESLGVSEELLKHDYKLT